MSADWSQMNPLLLIIVLSKLIFFFPSDHTDYVIKLLSCFFSLPPVTLSAGGKKKNLQCFYFVFLLPILQNKGPEGGAPRGNFYRFHSEGYGKVLDSMKRQNERHKKGEAGGAAFTDPPRARETK